MATNKSMLAALFNAANPDLPHALTEKDFAYKANPEASDSGKNTKLTIVANPDSENFQGEIELHYDRLDPNVIGQIELTDDLSRWEKQNELLAWVQYYIVKVKPDDSVSPLDVKITYEDQKDEHQNVTKRVVTCVTTAQNIRYLEGTMATFIITPKVVDKRVDLGTLNGELDGFTE